MAKEYIERQAPINAVTQDMGPHRTHDFNAGCARAVNRIIETPAADVVPVVRCGECENWQIGWTPSAAKGGTHFCANVGLCTSADWFCADGERKGGDG